ncbi:uncharacterized protein BKA78DRAFT_304682 [Phyllosticta capitalensis]|uniref:uncharacterized protein n=1 Tax=Phyllosticta capitalensis TaxID=121624 RepID=UPI00312E3ADD
MGFHSSPDPYPKQRRGASILCNMVAAYALHLSNNIILLRSHQACTFSSKLQELQQDVSSSVDVIQTATVFLDNFSYFPASERGREVLALVRELRHHMFALRGAVISIGYDMLIRLEPSVGTVDADKIEAYSHDLFEDLRESWGRVNRATDVLASLLRGAGPGEFLDASQLRLWKILIIDVF